MMNGSAIRTGECLHWDENPRTSALRDICTAEFVSAEDVLGAPRFHVEKSGDPQAQASSKSRLLWIAAIRSKRSIISQQSN
jgi:hypothetical protein